MLTATSTASPTPLLGQAGHWFHSAALASLLHIDGATKRVDARVELVAEGVGGPVLQGETRGFVAGRERILVFGKSTLRVEASIPAAAPETPVPVEVSGGPYLVYRQAGTVVRLGVPPLGSRPADRSERRPTPTTARCGCGVSTTARCARSGATRWR
ncbi:MAG: hypothetical protein ACRDRK_21990 [Pseudonocardia sp.]